MIKRTIEFKRFNFKRHTRTKFLRLKMSIFCLQVEMELFQHYRVTDLKALILRYLEDLCSTQLALLNHWQQFLPTINKIQ